MQNGRGNGSRGSALHFLGGAAFGFCVTHIVREGILSAPAFLAFAVATGLYIEGNLHPQDGSAFKRGLTLGLLIGALSCSATVAYLADNYAPFFGDDNPRHEGLSCFDDDDPSYEELSCASPSPEFSL